MCTRVGVLEDPSSIMSTEIGMGRNGLLWDRIL